MPGAAALQAKLGSALATVSASPVPATISQTPSVDTPLSAIMTATATAQEVSFAHWLLLYAKGETVIKEQKFM